MTAEAAVVAAGVLVVLVGVGVVLGLAQGLDLVDAARARAREARSWL